MTFRVFIFAICLSLASCADSSSNPPADSVPDSVVITDNTDNESLPWIEGDPLCDFPYDTITNPKYNMHKVIMDRYTVPGKRGYWMTANGDTMDTYLYPQDIHVWMMGLDTNEQGIYRMLTNKIAFLILAHDAAHFVHEDVNDPRVKYFIWHLQNPNCNEVPFERLEQRVDSTMVDPKVWEGSFKQKILSQIATQ